IVRNARVAAVGAHASRLVATYLPPRRKGLRLASAMERWTGRPAESLVARHQSGYKVMCDLSDDVQRCIFYTGTYEPRLSNLVIGALEPGDTFFDLGANIGHYSLLAAKRLGSSIFVHAFEPSADTAGKLRDTVAINRLAELIHVHQVAVADHSGLMTLAHPSREVSPVGMRFLDPSGTESGESVRTVRLDEYLVDVIPNVVKLDVEGAELRALNGMTKALEDPRLRCVFAEALDAQLGRFGDSRQKMTMFMEQYGFVAERIEDRYFAETIRYLRE
ncbi:MAG: FkbM family methyltransferase, partial [Nitrososphaerales archaeon]